MKLSEYDIGLWQKAGRLAAESLAYGQPLIKPGVTYLSVAEHIETFVRNRGGLLAFPVNISINDVAAHDSPAPNDTRVFQSEDLVKLDVGVHIQGYIGDNALTVDLSGKRSKLCAAAKAALAAVIKLAVPGAPLRQLGEAIEATIANHGFHPIKNLGGHQMAPYNLHCGVFVPNFKNNDKKILEEGMVLAIEPFAAETCDKVKDGQGCNIFNLTAKKVKNINEIDPLYSVILARRKLPFCLRDLYKKLPEPLVNQQGDALDRQKLLHFYPPLITQNGCLVAQFEHTVIVSNPPMITTLLP